MKEEDLQKRLDEACSRCPDAETCSDDRKARHKNLLASTIRFAEVFGEFREVMKNDEPPDADDFADMLQELGEASLEFAESLRAKLA